VIVATFVLTWAVALLIWRFAHVEERWAMHVPDTDLLAS
jgi:high-affinity nickel-transport protein